MWTDSNVDFAAHAAAVSEGSSQSGSVRSVDMSKHDVEPELISPTQIDIIVWPLSESSFMSVQWK